MIFFVMVNIENIANAFFFHFPGIRLVGDNIDYEIHARVQSQNHKNRSIHWTHQFAVLDRVQNPKLDSPDNPPLEIFLNEYAPRCNLVHFETQFWEMLQWYFIF